VANPDFRFSATGRVVAAWIYTTEHSPDYRVVNSRLVVADGTIAAAPDSQPPQLETGPLRRKGTVLRIAVKCSEPCSVRWRASARKGRRTLKASGEPIKASTGESRVVTATLPRVPRSQKVRLQLVVTDLARNVVRRTFVR
jgi:hypothetical protein